MNQYLLDDSSDVPLSGRKGKQCSMTGCNNNHQRCPNMSFFRFPKELSRSKEWLEICERPDLSRRVDIGDITINNYYVCEIHFPNQILDYSTRKILIKTAKPLSMAELEALPSSQKRRSKHEIPSKSRGYNDEYNEDYDNDDDYQLEDNKDEIKFRSFGVKIAKAEGNYHSDLLEPLLVDDENSYTDSAVRAPFCWTTDATKFLIKLRGERDAEFDQSGARKSQLWLEISNKMREAGYDFTSDKVSKKWHNITITYQKNAERDPSLICWEFFDDMHAIFRNKKIVDDSSSDTENVQIPKQNGMSKRKTAETSYRESPSPESDPDYRPGPRTKKKQRYEVDDCSILNNDNSFIPAQNVTTTYDECWWKTYFEQKLELERKRMEKEDERHKDRMNFQKMAIMLQERSEKIKVETMKKLTNALLRLQDTGKI